jgi:hypothetical protein
MVLLSDMFPPHFAGPSSKHVDALPDDMPENASTYLTRRRAKPGAEGASTDFRHSVVQVDASEPKNAAHDVVTFRTLRNLVHLAELTDANSDSAWIPVAEFWHVIRASPGRVNEMTIDQLRGGLIAQAAHWRTFDVYDNRLQIDALIQHDIAAHADDDMTRAAAAVTAELLIVVSPDDRIVGSGPALHFGELAGAEMMSVRSACGHFALYCEPAIGERVRAFLAAGPSAR